MRCKLCPESLRVKCAQVLEIRIRARKRNSHFVWTFVEVVRVIAMQTPGLILRDLRRVTRVSDGRDLMTVDLREVDCSFLDG